MRWLIILLAFFAASPAFADTWLRTESDNYIVHAALPETELKTVVQDMEDFRRVLQTFFPSDAKQGHKLALYLDPNIRRIRWAIKMNVGGFGGGGPELAAAFSYYTPSQGPDIRMYPVQFQQTQYYIDGSFFRTLPPWTLAGIPAVFAPSFRNEEGQFLVGVPSVNSPLESGISVGAIRDVLEAEFASRNDNAYRRFYRRSREMARVLLFDTAYSGRMEAYLQALTNGASLTDAAQTLGELEALDEAVKALIANSEPPIRMISLFEQPPVSIAVTTLPKGEEDLVALRFARILDTRPKTVTNRLRKLTRKHPESASVWYEYAAAEHSRVRKSLFGGEPDFRGFGFSNSRIIVAANPYSDRIAWEAVNRALTLDPDLAPARVLKAEILMARLLKADLSDDVAHEFEAMRALLEPLAAQPEQYPLAAAVAYQSYLEQEIEPPQPALDRLGRAFVANRGVEEFRYAYASALARVGERETAELLLRAMLFDPEFREAAQAALDQVRPQTGL